AALRDALRAPASARLDIGAHDRPHPLSRAGAHMSREPTLGALDLHLIGEGRHFEIGDRLGARPLLVDGVRGIAFAVWAPAARAVSVVGDFNQWSDSAHAMRQLGVSGVWELFVPEAAPGDRYKFAITGADGSVRLKADPVAH